MTKNTHEVVDLTRDMEEYDSLMRELGTAADVDPEPRRLLETPVHFAPAPVVSISDDLVAAFHEQLGVLREARAEQAEASADADQRGECPFCGAEYDALPDHDDEYRELPDCEHWLGGYCTDEVMAWCHDMTGESAARVEYLDREIADQVGVVAVVRSGTSAMGWSCGDWFEPEEGAYSRAMAQRERISDGNAILSTPRSSEPFVEVWRGLENLPPRSLVATPAEMGFACSNGIIDRCGFPAPADAFVRRVQRSLDRLARGPHVVVIDHPAARHPLVLYQSDRCAWHDSMYERVRGYEWIDLFHALGRTVGELAVRHAGGAIGLGHPSGGGWRLTSATAFLEGLGMSLDVSPDRAMTVYLSDHEQARGALDESLETLAAEQHNGARPSPRQLDLQRVDFAEVFRIASLPPDVEVEAWSLTLREKERDADLARQAISRHFGVPLVDG